MASDSLKSCLTCCRQTENFLRITESDEASEENVEAVFATHFWFTKDECHGRIVCTSCWEKIDDFHKFYCDVKKVHHPLIKQEQDDGLEEPVLESKEDVKGADDRLLYAEVICKLEEENKSEIASEPEANNPNDDESTSSSESESNSTSSDSDSDVPPVRRTKRKRRTRTNIELNCSLCADEGTYCEPFYTWYKLNVHFKQTHGQNGFMYCCSKRFVTKPLYLKHIKSHGRSALEQKHCLECKCSFKDESGLARHMIIFHTPEEEKQFKCDRCEKAFPEEDLLKSHISWHDEVEQLNHHCAICNRYFTGAGLLRTHNENHHSTVPAETATEAMSADRRKRSTPEDIAKQDELISQYVTMICSKCDFVGANFKELSSHAKSAHNMPTYSVICCERKFSKRFRLYEHCLKHLNPDHFKCELCDKTFTDSDGLQSHRWFIHTPVSERPFKCDVCGDAYVKEYLLKAHMDRHLDKERKTHTCDSCGVTYTTLPQLKAHQQNVHGAMSDWVCDVCAKGFAHRALLERHRLTHTEEGQRSLKEQCEKCHKWLINRTSYLRHRKLCGNSTGPAKCDLCEHVSVNAHALSVHKKLNHTDRPKYACQYCGKEFKKQLRLKEHEANHAGIVLYKCPFCPRECNSSSNMYTHKKTAHAEQWAAVVAAKHSK
ncbi:transcription factor grauzone-like [Culex pipiens pallens]|uniref:transcription factor grauzone-like n=1 Tax=Culex pipiens pallens TaxID=42434 RepID=UPI001954B231|nr:transcription factor grauzone-like [Culex pipiens pallens]XP_052562769.1 transcription factor grauzone-like [Culex pipiens pallens]